MYRRALVGLLFVGLFCLIAYCPPVAAQEDESDWYDLPPGGDVIYVPTPQDVVDKMLELAAVKKTDLVYDLGCGDGRIVVTAARKYGCHSVGYDIDPKRIAESEENIRKGGVEKLASVKNQNIFELDLSKANVVTLYLLPELNVRLIPQLEKLAPGSRIVSHDFDMRGVTPDKVVHVESDDNHYSHTVYLWTTPLKKVKPSEDEKQPAAAASR